MEWFKKNSKNIEVLFVTIFVLMIVLEFGFRIYHFSAVKNNIQKAYDNPDIPISGSIVPFGVMIRPSIHDKIVYELKPNMQVYYMGENVQTNSLGWREKEFSKEKNNTIRIVGIGDSVMFGWGVKEHQRYMDVLESMLNGKYPQKNWETYIFAVPGYSLFIDVEIIKKYAINYDPDLIIYGFVGNDMCLPNFITIKRTFFSRGSFMILYLKKYLDNTVKFYYETPEGEELWKVCDPNEVPSEYQKYIGEEAFFKQLKELKEINIPTIVLLHHNFQDNLKPEELYYFDGEINYSNLGLVISGTDKHPSIKGHKVIANKLFNQMIDNNIISSLLEK